MDVAGLRGRIQATLDPNAAIRQQAELDLKYAEDKPGFTDALLNILEAEQDNGVRLSTVVYLKNRVSKGWSPAEEFSQAKPIPENEKEAFRNRLVPILAASQTSVRVQLIPTLQKILAYDFPQRWPNFLDITIQLLNAGDANSVFAGVQCLLAICKIYRFKSQENRADFDRIVALSFPQLLNIGNSLVNETSLEAGEILRTVLKVYKHAIYFDLPASLREQATMVGWCTLFLTVVGKVPPECSLPEDLDERETNHWWKAKKWAYANLNRLYVRYGNPATLGKSNDIDYSEVAKYFITNFAPEILKGYLAQVEKWVGKTVWLSKACLYYTLNFLDECIKPKSMWNLLRPHTENLISHLLFPVLCQSDDDIELFDTEPQEYLHRKLNFYEEVTAPDVAATNFLVTLTKSRRKQTFSVLNFVNDIVNRYEAAPDTEKNPREKEGALRMIGTLSGVILGKKSPIANDVEYFFVRHVFPEFRSPHGFLRARACDTLEKFEALDFKDPNNLIIIYRNILESMADPALPVRVEAALALQPLIRHDLIRSSMQQNIPQVMQQLLKLANEVDVDALANVMEDFVEVFAAELTPFAVALSEQLRDTYLRIVRELLDRQTAKDDENEYGDFLDDKSITALGVLQTIGTLILTLESTPDVLLHLETILMPVITITLENKLYGRRFSPSTKRYYIINLFTDLYNEVFEIIDSCTFAAKSISHTMWQAFELIHRTFKAGAELYLEDMLPALENFVNYGTATLIQNRPYLDAIVDMVRTIFKDDKVGGVDRICGCKLSEIIMLNMRGHVDDYVPEFLSLTMTVLTNDEPKVKSLRIHLMEVVINSIYYNPALALHVLESNGWTNKFFSLWFSSIDSFSRVHDKKLCISAICALLTLRAQDVPLSVQQGWPRLLQGIVRLFQTLPAAVKNREEAKKEENFEFGNDYEDEDDEEWEQDNEWNNETEETEDVKDESAAYLEFLNEEARKFTAVSEEEDDELEEESLLETPLDKVEPYSMFKHALLRLQQEDPALYDNLTKQLNPEEQQVVQAAVHQADVIAQAAAQAAVQAQLSPNGNGLPPQ
ncbi:armadillo-type protein [Clohesyomyces aquaticus]|uniref:Armadillo-type protein n=1 Tax=Clohesyomyces aquaticus TaxID=1231657 RepID=A0A1Y1YY26_9PLEO|nr:armadillo-type protein [Clohesyomyces aquaticus]